ncbi:hypothetical protein WN944_001519 [Citrus x changshan-huyou]|uniref:RNase H type-1 domain-containing protein n=1 Tax=Citrus x changshan-huyou TaxID=2935761 RepID=A0AAP0QRG3_9ROSI
MQNFEKKSFYFVESVAKADLMDAFKKLKKFGQSFCREETIYDASKVESPPCSCCKGSAFQRVRKKKPSHIAHPRGEKQQKWFPPPENIFKINVDVAINTKNQIAGVGAVIRDSNGKIIAAGINQIHLKGPVSLAEAETVQWGLQLAKEADLTSLIIKSDCLEVVQLVNNTKGSKTEIFWTILEIRNQLKGFQKVIVHHILRQCNAYANSLAKLALGRNSSSMWLGTIPAKIQVVFEVL